MRLQSFLVVLLMAAITILVPSHASAESATLDDYWQGTAEWRQYHKMTKNNGWEAGGGVGGVQITVHNDKWYIIYRAVSDDPSCSAGQGSWTEIRESADQGKTWSPPIKMVEKLPNTPWSCQSTDGSIHYDATKDKWLYLFQCLSNDGKWNGCLAERAGSSPYGQFRTNNISNPVIPNGKLWNMICQSPNSRCPASTYDEGTFDIFLQDGDTYWFSFHGYDGVNGYRGIGKTKDFVTYETIPNAYLSSQDSESWRESWQGGSIGFGAGNILLDQGKYYSFNEAADLNLGCTANQNWDWGIYRSDNLLNWQPYPLGNPIFYSSKWTNQEGKSLPCLPAYGRIFRDSTDIFLSIVRADISSSSNWLENDGIHLYKLTPKTNLLNNSNFWKCSRDDWPSILDSTATIKRHTSQTTDGTCSLLIQKGDIYQDLTKDQGHNSYSFGIKAKADSSPSSIKLVVHELGDQGQIITHHSLDIAPSGEYQTLTKNITTSRETTTLRVQVYHLTGATEIEEVILTTTDALPGDLNSDGKVDIFDYQKLISNFGNPYTIFDYQKIISNFGK